MKELTTVSELELVTMAWYYIGKRLFKLQQADENKPTKGNKVLIRRWKTQENELYERMTELESKSESEQSQ